MLTRKLNLPPVNYLYPRLSDTMTVTAVSGVAQMPWLGELGLTSLSDLVITLQAWLPSHETTVIHKDVDPQGVPIPWTVLFCPVGHGNLILRLYEPKDSTATDVQSAPSGYHGVPTIDIGNATLLDTITIDEGSAIVFSPGKYYHSVENPNDRWINAISIRSIGRRILGQLEELLAK